MTQLLPSLHGVSPVLQLVGRNNMATPGGNGKRIRGGG
jgi:hypothetical protein